MSTVKEEWDGYILHHVEHFRQRYNWDCGVSCVLMILLKHQQTELLDRFTEICAEEGFGQSTWTIDLCYLLKRFGIKHHMYTSMMGVNENHKKQSYYSKILSLDTDRVQHRFSQASSTHISISIGTTSPNFLVQHLRLSGPAIVLVDAGLLVCDLCKHNKLKAEFRRCFGGGYKGHYILVVGYSARTDKFIYRDPALPARLCLISSTRMQLARSARGTDHDSILLHTQYNERTLTS